MPIVPVQPDRRLAELNELVQVENSALLYNEGNRTSIFYAESWAFVHYLLFSSALKSGTEFNELIQALKPGLNPDQVFQKVLGCNCAEMDRRLAQYLRGGKYRLIKIKFDRAEIEREAKNRPATGLEVAIKVGLAIVDLKAGRREAGISQLKLVAADQTATPKGTDSYARSISPMTAIGKKHERCCSPPSTPDRKTSSSARYWSSS